MLQSYDHSIAKRSIGRIFLDILKFVGFIILALIPMQMIVTLIMMQDQLSTTANSILGIICFLLIVLIILFLWNRYSTYSNENTQKIRGRDIGFAFLFFLLALFISIAGTSLIAWLYGGETTANEEGLMIIDEEARSFALYFILFVLATAILVPMAEELTFRGIGKHLLFQKSKFWLPLIMTSVIFGLMHTPTNIIAFFLYSLIGVVCFLAYHRRKNILDSMLVHILNNSFSTLPILASYIKELM